MKTKNKEIKITWPDFQFTIDEFIAANAEAAELGRPTVYSKIKESLESGELIKVGQLSKGRGRPKHIFQKAGQEPTQTTVEQPGTTETKKVDF